MKIFSIKLENIQGTEDLYIEPQCRNVEIRGQNGTGKTTIFNAFTFCLFGTMWDGTAAKIHRRDEGGNEIFDGTVHAVEMELYSENENREIKIRRELKDKFDKKGNFAGNVTECFVDGVATKPTDFNKFVESITNGASAILSNPFKFFELKWQDARKTLFDVFCANVTNKQVFARKSELEPLENLLGDLPAESLIAKLKNEVKSEELKLKDLPGQIKAYMEIRSCW